MAEKNNNDYIWLYNRFRSVTSLKGFMEREKIYNVTEKEFLDLNRELIWQQYSESDKEKEKELNGKWPSSSSDLTVDSWLPCPCNLKIQATKVTAELAISQTNFQSDTGDFYAFASDEISKIIQDEGYQIDSASKKAPTVQVFGWFKSLYYLGVYKGEEINLNKDSGEFSDISKHIISLNTLVSKDGGSFTIKLPIVNADSVIGFIMKDNGDETVAQKGYANAGGQNSHSQHSFRYGDEIYSKNPFGFLETNYFNWLISSNDLLFISFEKLEMEKDNNFTRGDDDNFSLQTQIADQVYDMIGLVDEVRVVSDSSGAQGYVEVTGRDLMKLLIEDGSFFFNPSTTSDPSMVFQNEQSYGKQGDIREADQMNNTYNNPINRLRRVTGEIDIFANRINMDLSYILKGVISQLANVEVVPGYVFDSWGDERTTYIELQPNKK